MTKTTYKTTAITTATKNFNDPVDDDDEVISRISRAGRRALPQLMALVPIYWTAAVQWCDARVSRVPYLDLVFHGLPTEAHCLLVGVSDISPPLAPWRWGESRWIIMDSSNRLVMELLRCAEPEM